uniref:Uncharacterized protein n=1 Tax=Lactuca sativa TaxID=4236 RepID=A0A9R1UKL5_LACSA|nr:hypothetical protein LSAT_V11C900471730 [Lactuca sativa]
MDLFQACFVAIGCMRLLSTGTTRPSIAFGMTMKNNTDCCIWFVMKLKESLGEGREVSFTSNVDDVVSSCIGQVFLDTYHGYTSKSVFMYTHRRVSRNRTLEPLFWMTSNSYIMSDFEQNFCRLTHDAREVLVNICHVKYARFYFPNIRWKVLIIDISQFMLVLLVVQHNVPIITLVVEIRDHIQRIFA